MEQQVREAATNDIDRWEIPNENEDFHEKTHN